MMISPQGFVEDIIKVKSSDEILATIKKQHREMARPNKKVENTDYDEEIIMSPSPQVKIDLTRDYIEASKLYLLEQGYQYSPSKMEVNAKKIDDDTQHIKRIVVEYGGFFGGAERRSLTKDKEAIIVERNFYNGAGDDGRDLYVGMSWKDILNEYQYVFDPNGRNEYLGIEILDFLTAIKITGDEFPHNLFIEMLL